MATILIRYWAGARSAAGVDSEAFEAPSCRAALDLALAVRPDPQALTRVLAASSFLVDGVARRRADLDRPVTAAITLEVLPPFAGG